VSGNLSLSLLGLYIPKNKEMLAYYEDLCSQSQMVAKWRYGTDNWNCNVVYLNQSSPVARHNLPKARNSALRK
jgi:hypothetical protein